MAIDNFGTTNYVKDMEDLAAYRMQNPPDIKTTVPNNESSTNSVTAKPKTDSFKAVNNEVLATKTPARQYLQSNLQIQIKDKDGFTNFGKADLRATVSGDINITKDMLLDQLGKMKDGPDKKFNPPRFDADRQQFVISGTGIDALLGSIDVPFEIRLGVKDGNLAFLVDSMITRGSVYSDLKSMMLDAGIETYEKDKTLFIKPTVGQPIDIPFTQDKSHTGRIEWIDSNSDNTKMSIDKNGIIHIKLKEVQMIASTDISQVNKKIEKPDVASIKFDFSLDENLKPEANFRDGTLDANVTKADIEKYVGKENLSFMQQTFGTALSLSLTGLGGHFEMTDKGVDLNATANLTANATDSDATLSTGLKVQLENTKPIIDANDLKAKLIGNQKIIADHVGFDSRKEGINVDAQGIDASIFIPGVNINAQGSGNFSSAKDALSASFTGKTNGNVDKDGFMMNFNTAGNHNISSAKNKLEIIIDQAKIKGSYDSTVRGFQKDPSEKQLDGSEKTQINVEVKNIDADAHVKTSIANISTIASGGGLKAEIGKDIHISSDAKLTGVASGDQLNGSIEVKGTDVNVKEDGSINIQANNTKANAQFKTVNKKITVGGKVNGDINVNVDNKGTVDVQTQNGNFDAKFQVNNKPNNQIKVDAKGKDAYVKIDQQQNINVKLNNIDAHTDIKANKVRVKAHTKGESVSIDAVGDDVNIQSKNTTSVADVKVKDILVTKGTTGDVSVKVHETLTSQDVKIDVKKANVSATLKNANGNLNVDMSTKADVKIHVDTNDNVSIASKNAQTKAHLSIVDKEKNKKVDLNAQSKDFNVDVLGDDINIKIKDANFGGKITPNEKIKVNAQSTTNSDISIKIKDKPDFTNVNIGTKSALKGDVSIDGKLKSYFNNKDGFNLFLRDSEQSTNIKTGINGINLDGSFNTGDFNLGVKGSGNFDLNVMDKPENSDVNIGYDGKLVGNASMKDLTTGTYSIDGKSKVNVVGDDINVNVQGDLNADLDSKKFGIGAKVNSKGTAEQPIKVSINTKNEPIVNVNIGAGGFIELKDIDKLKINEPTVTMILNKIKTKSAKIVYQDLDIKNNAEKVSVNVHASGIKTEFGNVNTSLSLKKDGSTVQIDKGVLVLQPNIKLYDLIVDEVAKKYKINIVGKPELKDGTLKLQGEVRTKTGIVQLADFNIKANVIDNNLILDLDKATVLKVIGANAVNTVINKVLNHTDIDHLKIDKSSITIKLADIFKDLSLTEGVNFTGLNLKDDKIQVGFVYNSIDKDVAGFAKKKDVNGLSQYIKTLDYKYVSGEALSTAYSTFADAKDVNKSSSFIADLVKMYSNNSEISKKEFDKGLTWISKNQGVKKSNIQDNITLDFTKLIQLKTPNGDNLIKALPYGVVSNLANNLDQTISQGAGMSLIFPEERSTANYLRKLKGIPENNASF